jgi:hypothetical protein
MSSANNDDDAAEILCCAACGIAEVDDMKLKKCTVPLANSFDTAVSNVRKITESNIN